MQGNLRKRVNTQLSNKILFRRQALGFLNSDNDIVQALKNKVG